MSTMAEVSINSDSELENGYIQISKGYTQGQDQLVLTGNHPGISLSWALNEGILTLSGNTSEYNYESAITSVVFQTRQTNFTEDKVFCINLGDANFCLQQDTIISILLMSVFLGLRQKMQQKI